MDFVDFAGQERPGHCRMLRMQRGQVMLCNQPTTKSNPLCYDCYKQSDAEIQAYAKAWPPIRKGRETRILRNLDDAWTGLLSWGECNLYFGEDLPRPGVKKGGKQILPETPKAPKPQSGILSTEPFHAIDIPLPPPSAQWKEGDELHRGYWTVYALRLGDGSYYIGQTRKSADERHAEHAAGQGAAVCRKHGVERLVFHARTRTRQAAREVERYTVSLLRSMGLRATMGSNADD